MTVLAYFLLLLFVFIGVLMIGIILLQRGRGGGLAGALGGMGGQSAFGTKAGDMFTRITVGFAVAWFVVAALCVYTFRAASEIYDNPLGDDPTPSIQADPLDKDDADGTSSSGTGTGNGAIAPPVTNPPAGSILTPNPPSASSEQPPVSDKPQTPAGTREPAAATTPAPADAPATTPAPATPATTEPAPATPSTTPGTTPETPASETPAPATTPEAATPPAAPQP